QKQSGWSASIIRITNLCKRFPELDRNQIGRELIEAGFGEKGLLAPQDFPSMPREALVSAMGRIIFGFSDSSNARLAEAISVNGQYTPHLSAKLAEFSEAMGSTPSADLFIRYRDGQVSLEELRTGMEELRKLLDEENTNALQNIESHPLFKE